MVKKQYKDKYLNLGFIHVTKNGIIKPHCVICAKFLSNDSFKHLEAKHNTPVNKERNYFAREEQKLKRQRLDAPTNAVIIRVKRQHLLCTSSLENFKC